MSWVQDHFLLVSSIDYIPGLINAFSGVLEYEPFAKYQEPGSGLVTVEWDKKDPAGRYIEIQKEGKLGLESLNNKNGE